MYDFIRYCCKEIWNAIVTTCFCKIENEFLELCWLISPYWIVFSWYPRSRWETILHACECTARPSCRKCRWWFYTKMACCWSRTSCELTSNHHHGWRISWRWSPVRRVNRLKSCERCFVRCWCERAAWWRWGWGRSGMREGETGWALCWFVFAHIAWYSTTIQWN